MISRNPFFRRNTVSKIKNVLAILLFSFSSIAAAGPYPVINVESTLAQTPALTPTTVAFITRAALLTPQTLASFSTADLLQIQSLLQQVIAGASGYPGLLSDLQTLLQNVRAALAQQ